MLQKGRLTDGFLLAAAVNISYVVISAILVTVSDLAYLRLNALFTVSTYDSSFKITIDRTHMYRPTETSSLAFYYQYDFHDRTALHRIS